MSKISCKDCKYFDSRNGAAGYCRSNTPGPDGWPEVNENGDDWCGHFEPKEGELKEGLDGEQEYRYRMEDRKIAKKHFKLLQYHYDKLAYDMEQLVRNTYLHADGRPCGDEETKCEVSCTVCAIVSALDRSWYEIVTEPMEEPERPVE